MKKLTNILESLKNDNKVAAIKTVEAFKEHVHEQLSSIDNYDEDTAEQLSESLLTENRNDVQLSIKGFATFMKG